MSLVWHLWGVCGGFGGHLSDWHTLTLISLYFPPKVLSWFSLTLTVLIVEDLGMFVKRVMRLMSISDGSVRHLESLSVRG